MRSGCPVALALLLTGSTIVPSASADQSTRSPAAAATPAIRDMETEIARRVNAIRQEQHRERLRVDPALTQVARDHACALARRDTLSHRSASGQTVADRVRAAGKEYREVGENLASNLNARDPVATAVTGWMRSPGHRENILRPGFTETGVGICRDGDGAYYFTQVFLRPA